MKVNVQSRSVGFGHKKLTRAAALRRAAKPVFEQLETRKLFSGALHGGQLYGEPDPDPIPVDDYEPNNSFAAATQLGTTNDRQLDFLTLHLVTGGDKDYFTFTAPNNGTVGVGITFSHLDGNLRLDGYTASGQATPTWSSNTSTLQNGYEGFTINATAGQQYWIKVSGNSTLVSSHDYSLNIQPLSASFDYTMPSRFGQQRDQFGFPIINNSASYAQPNFVNINGTLYGRFDVRLDATGTFLGENVTNYHWSISSALYGTVVDSASRITTVPLVEGTYNVTLTATGASGTQVSTSHSINVRDRLIVAMGDSYGAGEGNPEQDQQYGFLGVRTDYSYWSQGPDANQTAEHLRAHRSGWAGIVKMAEQLEQSDPKSSVTFIFLDHTGATIPHLLDTFQPSGDERYTTTDAPQTMQLRGIVGSRHIDAMYLSIGGNDAGFTEIGGQLVAADPEIDGPAYQGKLNDAFALAAQKIATLGGLYHQLAQRLDTFDIGQVFLNEYPDPTHDSSGGTPAKILDDIVGGYELDANEINQVRTKVLIPMVREMVKAAHAEGWSYVSDIASQFNTHGYGDWFRTATQSILAQGPLDNSTWVSLGLADKTKTTGTLHPNHEGQDVYRWRDYDAYSAADLVTTNFTLSPDAFATSNGTYTITVKNLGQYATAGASTAKIFVSTDTSFDGTDKFVADIVVPPLAPGQSVTLSGNVPLTTISSPVRNNIAYCGAILDVFHGVTESDEVNIPVGANDIVAVRVDRDLTTGEAPVASPTSINVGQLYQGKLGIDELAGAYDFDFYTFNVVTSGTYAIDIDNLPSSPNLPSQLQLFTVVDGQPWFQLSWDTGTRAPGEPATVNGESYIQYSLTPGTYFIVVANANTSPFLDPLNPLFRNPGQQGSYSLSVTPVVSTPAWLSPSPGAVWSLVANELTVSQGSVTFTGDASSTHPNLNVTIQDGASAIINSSEHLVGLNIQGTGQVSMSPNGSRLVRVASLSIASNASFDLNDNDLVLDYNSSSPRGAIQSWINQARAGGAWTGKGVTSAAAKSRVPKITTLGVMEASEFKAIYGVNALFDGETLDNTTILVKYTYYGDNDFNGVVNFDDYSRTDNGFITNKTGWNNGDFDGSGAVNFDDYALIDLAFNNQTSAL